MVIWSYSRSRLHDLLLSAMDELRHEAPLFMVFHLSHFAYLKAAAPHQQNHQAVVQDRLWRPEAESPEPT